MQTINGNEIVKFIYDTDYEQFEGETREDASRKFESWINNNTPYRGLGMYAKHKGYHLIFEDASGNRYIQNGMRTYKIDQYKNLIEEIK